MAETRRPTLTLPKRSVQSATAGTTDLDRPRVRQRRPVPPPAKAKKVRSAESKASASVRGGEEAQPETATDDDGLRLVGRPSNAVACGGRRGGAEAVSGWCIRSTISRPRPGGDPREVSKALKYWTQAKSYQAASITADMPCAAPWPARSAGRASKEDHFSAKAQAALKPRCRRNRERADLSEQGFQVTFGRTDRS